MIKREQNKNLAIWKDEYASGRYVVKHRSDVEWIGKKSLTIYTTKTETHHVELINSQTDHKRWTSFVYIGPEVCQLLLH